MEQPQNERETLRKQLDDAIDRVDKKLAGHGLDAAEGEEVVEPDEIVTTRRRR
jgi:hypothetical protein